MGLTPELAEQAGLNGSATESRVAGGAMGGPADTRTRRVVVVGLGYVGLPTALMLSRAGHRVTGVDTSPGVLASIASGGGAHVGEAEVQALLGEPDVKRNLVVQDTPTPADVFILAVPTPVDERRKQADLSALVSATRSIAPVLRPGNLVIVESTVPPLTCRQVVAPIIESAGLKVLDGAPHERVLLAHCPERVLPGNIVHELVHNDRVIGGLTPEAGETARELYGDFVQGPIRLTDDVTAELCKLMENTYRDVNIALANELAAVAENLGVDAAEAITLANQHPRVRILSPGIGVGGHCIPVDPWFIKEVDPEHSRLIVTAREVNDAMPARVAAKIRRALSGVRGPRVVAVGATYKPNTNDLRGSPAIEVVRLLREDGYDVSHHDPIVPGWGYSSLADACEGADCLVVLVPHDVVACELDTEGAAIRRRMRRPRVLTF